MNGRTAVRVAAVLCNVPLVVAILQTSPQNAGAEYIPPSKVVVRTKAYQPQETNFPRGTYDYQVAWQGIPVGSASIRIGTTYRDGKKMLDVEATARSGGIVSLFYRLEHRSESIFSAQELKPVTFVSQQTENSRFTNLLINFAPDGAINARVTKGRLNSAGKSEEVSFRSNATFDPISAAFLARSLPLNPAEDASFDVFNGSDRYLISLHVVGREDYGLGQGVRSHQDRALGQEAHRYRGGKTPAQGAAVGGRRWQPRRPQTGKRGSPRFGQRETGPLRSRLRPRT